MLSDTLPYTTEYYFLDLQIRWKITRKPQEKKNPALQILYWTKILQDQGWPSPEEAGRNM